MELRIVFEPDYRVPHVFNLHERGFFAARPFVYGDVGARVVVDASGKLFLQGRRLMEETGVHTESGRRYRYVAETVIVPLTQKLTLNKRAFGQVDDAALQDEIAAVFETWLNHHTPRRKDGKLDQAELKKRLAGL